MFLTGLHVHGLPHDSIGYVYWPAWLLIIAGSLIAVPFGVRWSHRLSTKKLKSVFALFLLLVRCAYDALLAYSQVFEASLAISRTNLGTRKPGSWCFILW